MYSGASVLTKETGHKIKTKLDQAGVSEAVGKISTQGKQIGGIIYQKAKNVGESVSEKIDNSQAI